MALHDLLDQMEALDAAKAPEGQPVRTAPRLATATDVLLCVDASTQLTMPDEVRDFYAYRRGWRLHAFDLEWPAPEDMADLLKDTVIVEMLEQDMDQGLLIVPGMRRSNTVLLAFDDLPAVFQRAYLVMGDGGDCRVVDAGSEVVIYPDLKSYLTFWRDVLEAS